MKHALEKCAHIFTDEEKMALEKEMAKCSKEEFELKLGNAAIDFAAKMAKEDEEKKMAEDKKEFTLGFSYGLPLEPFSAPRQAGSSPKSLDELFNSYELRK